MRYHLSCIWSGGSSLLAATTNKTTPTTNLSNPPVISILPSSTFRLSNLHTSAPSPFATTSMSKPFTSSPMIKSYMRTNTVGHQLHKPVSSTSLTQLLIGVIVCSLPECARWCESNSTCTCFFPVTGISSTQRKKTDSTSNRSPGWRPTPPTLQASTMRTGSGSVGKHPSRCTRWMITCQGRSPMCSNIVISPIKTSNSSKCNNPTSPLSSSSPLWIVSKSYPSCRGNNHCVLIR